MRVLVGQPDRPVRLLLALAPGERVGVEGRHPPPLPRPTRAVKEGEDAVRIVHGGDLRVEN